MKKQAYVILLFSHIAAIAIGFALGLYTLPILIAPPAPSESEIEAMSSQAVYSGQFTRELKGSDAFHWGEGTVSLGNGHISFLGMLAPGPDYKLYLSPAFVETEAQFEQLKPTMVLIGDVKTFDNFIVNVRPGIDLASFNTVVIWCETFGEFITAAQYRQQ
jgi:hypothetical protein